GGSSPSGRIRNRPSREIRLTILRRHRGAVVLLLVAPSLFASSSAPQAIRDVVFVGTDYAFVAPAPVHPGLAAITFDNRGKQRHEMSLRRLRPGITLDSVVKVGPGPHRRALIDVNSGGILFAEPGQRTMDRLLVNFEE